MRAKLIVSSKRAKRPETALMRNIGIGLILNTRSYERTAKKDEEAIEEQAVENNSEVE